jgi:hypothetical protein
MFIDHKNGNKLDNSRENLRKATKSENCQNSKTPKSNSSGYKNVCWYKQQGKWGVNIRSGGESFFGGLFEDISEANKAAIRLREELNGEYGRG